MSQKKERLDKVLVDRGLFSSRSQARRIIMAGEIKVDGQIMDKPGTKVLVDAEIEYTGDRCPYVSRGGLKLEKALKVFDINVEGKKVIDIGASTGGFTDCLLQNGAVEVYSVDVGYGQLAWKLRQDPRVKVMERFNFRHAQPEDFNTKFDFATIDVSFISLNKIFPPLVKVLREGAGVISLIKPQFEAGPEKVGKKGVVKDPEVHREVIFKVLDEAALLGLNLKGLSYSPIKGAQEGNIEFLAYFMYSREEKNAGKVDTAEVERIISEAHENLM